MTEDDAGTPICTYALNLVTLEQTQTIDEDPRQRAAKVDQLVDHERHDTGGQDIVLHPRVPGRPQALGNVQVGIVLANLLELTPVGGRREHGRIPVHVPRGQVSMGDLDGTAQE